MDETRKPAGGVGSTNRYAWRDPAGSDGRGSPLSAPQILRAPGLGQRRRSVSERPHFLAELLNYLEGSYGHVRRPSLVLRATQLPIGGLSAGDMLGMGVGSG